MASTLATEYSKNDNRIGGVDMISLSKGPVLHGF